MQPTPSGARHFLMRAGAATGSGARCALHPPLPPPARQSVMAPALPLPRPRDLPHPDLLPPSPRKGRTRRGLTSHRLSAGHRPQWRRLCDPPPRSFQSGGRAVGSAPRSRPGRRGTRARWKPAPHPRSLLHPLCCHPRTEPPPACSGAALPSTFLIRAVNQFLELFRLSLKLP